MCWVQSLSCVTLMALPLLGLSLYVSRLIFGVIVLTLTIWVSQFPFALYRVRGGLFSPVSFVLISWSCAATCGFIKRLIYNGTLVGQVSCRIPLFIS